jgi:hypothetical protein
MAVSDRRRIRVFPPAQHPSCVLEAEIGRFLRPDCTLVYYALAV